MITILLLQEGCTAVFAEKPFSMTQVHEADPMLILLHNGLGNEGVEICLKLKPNRRPVIFRS
jgi:hypothetical protein